MDRWMLFDRLLTLQIWVDGVLAAVIGLLLLARASPYRTTVPMRAYRWAFAVGLVLWVAWGASLILGFGAVGGGDTCTAIDVRLAFPAILLGAEAGAAGTIALSWPWKVCPLVFGVVNGLLALAIISLMIRF